MMDTMLSFGISGMTVPSSVTMPRETLVMDGGSVTLHWRVRLRMSVSSWPTSISDTSHEP